MEEPIFELIGGLVCIGVVEFDHWREAIKDKVLFNYFYFM